MGFFNRKETEQKHADAEEWVRESEKHHNYRSNIGDKICSHSNMADTGQKFEGKKVVRCTATDCGHTTTV